MSFFRPSVPIPLLGPSMHLPPTLITNEELVNRVVATGRKLRASWIKTRTGVEERHWAATDEAVSDLGTEAALTLLRRVPALRDSIRQLVLATVSGDFPSPPSSPLIQARLGLEGLGCFDLGAACAGFISGLHVSAALAQATGETVLLVAADIRSKFLSLEDFATFSLFADGAAAVAAGPSLSQADYLFLGSECLADGREADLIQVPAGGSRRPGMQVTDPRDFTLRMKDGGMIFLKAVQAMAGGATAFLARFGLEPRQIRWLVPHQANLHLIREVGKALGLPGESVVETIQYTGNTSGASVGIALHELRASPARTVAAGDHVLLASAGAGGLAAFALLQAV